jgi:hypothetical protein
VWLVARDVEPQDRCRYEIGGEGPPSEQLSPKKARDPLIGLQAKRSKMDGRRVVGVRFSFDTLMVRQYLVVAARKQRAAPRGPLVPTEFLDPLGIIFRVSIRVLPRYLSCDGIDFN